MTEFIQNNQVAALAETDTDGGESKYVVLQPLWHNREWVQTGQAFDDSETNVTAAQLGQYVKNGFLISRQAYRQQQNPEAARAESETDQLKAEIATLRQQLADAQGGGENEELKKYQDTVGPLLPDGLAPQAKASLVEAGFVGKKLLGRVPDEELRKLSGVADATIKTLRDFAPLQQ
ncbi:hypothetical protein GCM10022631_11290 [Deinococcus rubellus]|uniref:hypothetical protein n=1 Tax=Deinococcus rubellus TaxID=1889240 RepID=UPI0031E991D5